MPRPSTRITPNPNIMRACILNLTQSQLIKKIQAEAEAAKEYRLSSSLPRSYMQAHRDRHNDPRFHSFTECHQNFAACGEHVPAFSCRKSYACICTQYRDAQATSASLHRNILPRFYSSSCKRTLWGKNVALRLFSTYPQKKL